MISILSTPHPLQRSSRRRRDSRTIIAIGCIALCLVQLKLARRVATPSDVTTSSAAPPSYVSARESAHVIARQIEGADQKTFIKRQSEGNRVSDSMAACLLVMDDNHWLIEWLAFHWHVLPLRTLLVVRDPHSKTSPMPILERWKNYMNITVWDDTKFVKPWMLRQHEAGKMPQWRLHRYRQQLFYPACLRALKSESRQALGRWVLLVDTDELVRPNPYYPWPSGNGSDLSTPGSVLRSVNEFERFVDPKRRPSCLHIPRLQMSARAMDDGDAETIESVLRKRDVVNSSHLLTTSWFYHSGKEISTGHDHLDGKNLINVDRIVESNIPAKTMSVHYVLPSVCPVKVHRNESPIIIHHFLGTLEQFTSRSDPRDSIAGRPARNQKLYQSYKGKVKDMSLVTWLPGFIQSVGAAEAQRLLEGVGKVQKYC